MTYVDKILAKFGGIRPAARELKLPPTSVQWWKDNGSIHDKHKRHVLETARKLGLDLTEADFFPLD